MSLPPARRMSTLAARGLTEEIAELREEIAEQSVKLRNIELLITAVYIGLHGSNRAQMPE
jgi:hypothetical protein